MTLHALHVITPAHYGGLEQVVQCLVTAQVASGYRVSVAAMIEHGAPEPDILEHLRHGGAAVFPIVTVARGYVKQMRLLNTICNTIRPDVIHAHGYVADVLLAVLGSRVNAPVVTTVHGFTGGSRKNRTYEWLQRRAFGRFSAVVAVSAKLGAQLRESGIRRDKVHVIPNAYPSSGELRTRELARAALNVPSRAFSIGWIGRVSREKGLDVLLDALPELAGLDWRLTVIGDGRERIVVENGVIARAHAGRIGWAGPVKNASELVRAFDVIVISSRTEGTPMTLLEAMMGAVPIVTTAVGGIPDVVSAGEAILVPPEDPRALSQAIRAVSDDPRSAASRAERAHERLVREFSMQTFVARYAHVYEGIARRDDRRLS